MPAVLERPAILVEPAPAIPVHPMPVRERVAPSDIAFDFQPVPEPSPEPRVAHNIGTSRGVITDTDELGRHLTTSAISAQSHSFAVGCRSTAHATRFANPMRSLLLTLGCGFESTSATISPSLLMHTFPAMEAMVRSLNESDTFLPWQPDGERSIRLGGAKHLFISYDMPMPDDARGCRPDTLLEVVGAHLIPARWFDQVVAPKCDMNKLTIAYYGMVGIEGSLFERAWRDCDTRAVLNSERRSSHS